MKNFVFSLGIVLFFLISCFVPFKNATFTDFRYKFIIKEQYDEFWKSLNCNENISHNFKDLFERMICFDPKERLSLNEIKNHSWINYNCEECNIFNFVNDDCTICTNSNFYNIDNEMVKEFSLRKNLIDCNMKKE